MSSFIIRNFFFTGEGIKKTGLVVSIKFRSINNAYCALQESTPNMDNDLFVSGSVLPMFVIGREK
jgi:hypothetical protein